MQRILSNLMKVRDKTSVFLEKEQPRKTVSLSPRLEGSKRQDDCNN